MGSNNQFAAAYLAGSTYTAELARLMLCENGQHTAPPWAHRGYAHGPSRGRQPKKDRTPNPHRYTAKPQPGRNDPCSCGSGKKYKKCCGAPVPPYTPPVRRPAVTPPESDAKSDSTNSTAEALLRTGTDPAHVYAYCKTKAYLATPAKNVTEIGTNKTFLLTEQQAVEYQACLDAYAAATPAERVEMLAKYGLTLELSQDVTHGEANHTH